LIGDVLAARPVHAGMPVASGGEPETAILRRVREAAEPSTANNDVPPSGDRPAAAGVRGTP
jgi:hypothetical protein